MYLDQSRRVLEATSKRLLLLPIGSCEQHGPYLPIDTDLRIAQLLAEQLGQTFADAETLILPAIPFSCSWEHQGLGTIALHVSTFAAVLHDIASSLTTWEMPGLLILVSWHGGNDLLASLAAEITATEGLPTAVIPTIGQIGKAWESSGITTAHEVHAGAIETSVIQAFWPELIKEIIPPEAHCEPHIAPAKAQAILQALGTGIATREGIWGAPEQADAEKGKRLIENLVKSMQEQLTRLLELVSGYQQQGVEA